MATLEKIRSKSVLLVVVIALALVAFILTDAISNCRNISNDTTIAKVGDEKIEYQDFQRKQQELSQQLEEARRQNPQQYAGYDSQLLSQQTLEQLINEMLLNDAVKALDITASPEMLRYYMIENPIQTPEMVTLINSLRQSGVQVNSVEEAYNAIFNPQSVGMNERQMEPFQRAWIAMEAQYGKMINQMIYVNLFNQSFKANKLDKEAMKNDYVASANVKVAKKPYGELDEKQYPVSDDEVKKAYEEQKEMYAIPEETKEISFIAINVMPSEEDQKNASELAQTVVTELKAGGVTKETRKNGLDVRHNESTLAGVRNMGLKMFLQSAPIDSVAVMPGAANGFSVVKLNSRSMQVDSLKLGFITVVDNPTLVQKVSAYANSGMPLDSINQTFSADSVFYQAPEWVELYSADNSVPKNLGLQQSLYDSLLNNTGKYLEIGRQAGEVVRFASVTAKSSPTEIVDYETVDYTVHPSDATVAAAREKLQKFLNENNTAEKFEKNAAAAGYSPVDLYINPSTPAISMGFNQFYPDSRAVVRWVVRDGKNGEVSKIYQDRDMENPKLYAAAIINTYNDYMPWDNKEIKEQLTAKVRRSKAGDDMIKKYAKSTVDESAQAMGVEARELPQVQSQKFDGFITDAKVKGRIMGSKASNKVQAAKGDDAVYVYVINAVTQEPIDEDAIDFGEMFIQAHQVDPSAVLRGTKKIENNIYKFEAAE